MKVQNDFQPSHEILTDKQNQRKTTQVHNLDTICVNYHRNRR